MNERTRIRRAAGLTARGNSILKSRTCESCDVEFVASGRRRQCDACLSCACGERRVKGKPNCQPCLTSRLTLAREVARDGKTCPVFHGDCIICGAVFVSQHTRVTCSSPCQAERKHDRATNKNHRRRVLQRDAYVAPVVRRRIYERDKWRCHLCRRMVSKKAVVPHPRAATLDHLVPLASGGTHEPANVATACFRCNCLKGDRGGGEQLMLVG